MLEADRVERIAIIGPGPTLAVVDIATVRDRLRFVADDRLLAPACSGSTSRSGPRREPFDPDAAAQRGATGRTCAIAAEMVGVAAADLRHGAAAYAKERKQFDVPIGSFQAIQHKLADMSLALERATAAVQYAAMTVDADAGDRTLAVPRRRRPRPARRRGGSSRTASQIHGGIGYTWEHDLHLYLRRATADEDLLGTTGWHLDRIADLLFDDRNRD